jgi:putative DNA primase/helicase
MRLAIATGREIALEAAEKGDTESLKWAAKVNDAPRLRNMVSLAQSYCETRLNAFDADPWKLNCNSGIIDLKTGELLPHSPGALMRKLAPVEFDPKAECPTFLKFLDRIFDGDAELIGFLQRMTGYCLTGDTSEQCLFVLIGTGANGKSTHINVIHRLLGDYAQQTPMETLMVTKSGNVPNDIARLEGARFVAAVEAEAGQRLAEAKLKQLTGGDRLAARFLNAEFFEFIPQFKLVLATNKLPEIKGTDDGIWRRIRLIPFNETIPEAERDRRLAEKLEAESSGILNWALAGCLDWQRNGGLCPPAKVTNATTAYRIEMDMVAQFIDDCCVIDRQVDVTLKALFDGYAEWCHANGETALSQRAFGQRLRERSFKQGHTRMARKWLGIRLKTDAELLRVEAPEPSKRSYQAAHDDEGELEFELADVAGE